MFQDESVKIVLGIVAGLAILAVIIFVAKGGKKNMGQRLDAADKNAKEVERQTLDIMK